MHDHQRAVSGSGATVRTGRASPTRVAAQRHTMTPPSTRTNSQSAFTQKRSIDPKIRAVWGLRRSLLRDWPQAGHEGGGSPGSVSIPSRYPLPYLCRAGGLAPLRAISRGKPRSMAVHCDVVYRTSKPLTTHGRSLPSWPCGFDSRRPLHPLHQSQRQSFRSGEASPSWVVPSRAITPTGTGAQPVHSSLLPCAFVSSGVLAGGGASVFVLCLLETHGHCLPDTRPCSQPSLDRSPALERSTPPASTSQSAH